MSIFDEEQEAFLLKVERKAKKAALDLEVFLDLRKKFIMETIHNRFYELTGKSLRRGKPYDCVFEFEEGHQPVRIQKIEMPYISKSHIILRFEKPNFFYQIKLKNGKWSKNIYEADAEWALDHINQS